MLSKSSQNSLDYLLAHCLPEETEDVARRFDTLLASLAGEILGSDIADAPCGVARLRLPLRHSGLGIRSRVDLRDPAFTVRIAVDELPVCRGGVGWRVSVGALVLADWVLRHPSVCEGQAVLELGSGLGVTGLAAARAGAARVCLTDAVPSLVSNLARTIALNSAADAGGDVSQPCQLEARLLDLWDGPHGARRCATHMSIEETLLQRQSASDHLPPLPAAERFDVVLAAECMYEEYHAAMLPRTIARRLRRGSARARSVVLQAVREARPLHPAGMLGTMVASARAEGLALVITVPRVGDSPPRRIAFTPDGPDPDEAAWPRGAQLVLLELTWHMPPAHPGQRAACGARQLA
ncbi:hypothetical protein KFE25_007686 [Diacronema lutheri]|uniref:Calmodulin-lysine N-methyltransferase n=1 Tax=Diacronema lutheri TaxID=2081491 RepID=A0A8J5XPL6_DIALT|nr:hypothetical protein KFE25_007686 [Diacronema lutheri]